MNIYPAIDMMEGRAVRLTQGDKQRKTDYGTPRELAAQFKRAGALWVHMVDLDGAFNQSSLNKAIAMDVAATSGLRVQLGGGIRDLATMSLLLNSGISRIILGTIALHEPELVRRAVTEFGSERIVVGIDAREGRVAVHGWVEGSNVTPLELALRMKDAGVSTIIYTDIAHDGMLNGPNISATRELVEKSGLNIIASGGIGGIGDVRHVAKTGCEGVIIGKAIYEGRVSVEAALKIAAAQN